MGEAQFAQIDSSVPAVSAMLQLRWHLMEIELSTTSELGDEARKGTLIPTCPPPKDQGQLAKEGNRGQVARFTKEG